MDINRQIDPKRKIYNLNRINKKKLQYSKKYLQYKDFLNILKHVRSVLFNSVQLQNLKFKVGKKHRVQDTCCDSKENKII